MTRRLKILSFKVVPLSKTSLVADDAEPLEVTLNGFRCKATAQILTAEPEDDYDDVAEARSVLQPALDAWSATSELIDQTPVAFEPKGHHFEVVAPEGEQVVYALGIASTVEVAEAVVVVKHGFPAPHDTIRTESPVVAQLRRRWRNVTQGTESPIAVGYFVLTTVEHYFGGQQGAPRTLNISSKVWSTLRRLCSTDDPNHGRKAGGWAGGLTDEDLHWIKFACPAIIRRVLEYEAGADTSRAITKADLPPLTS